MKQLFKNMLIPNGVQSCIKDLNAVNVQLLEATKAINQFNNTDLVELKVHKPITDSIEHVNLNKTCLCGAKCIFFNKEHQHRVK